MPTDDEILDYLKQIAREELELRPEQVAVMELDTPVVEGLQLDSLAQVILLSRIEEHYRFVLDLEDREHLQTVQTIRELVEMIRRRAQGGTA